MKKRKRALVLIVLVIIFLILFGFFLRDVFRKERPELNAYEEVLSEHLADMPNGFAAELIYIDEDDTYELAIIDGSAHSDGAYLYTYKDGSVVSLADKDFPFFGSYGSFCYVEKENLFSYDYDGAGMIYSYAFRIEDKKAVPYCSLSVRTDFSEDEKIKYKNFDEEITKDEYDSLIKKYCMNDDWIIVDYSHCSFLSSEEDIETFLSQHETDSDDTDKELVKKCLDGYAKYLEMHPELWENETVYSLEYVTNDDIPDLVFGGTMGIHASNIYILTYLDENYDEVICCGPFGSYGVTSYYPRLGIMYTTDTGMGYDTEYYSILSTEKDSGCKTLCHRYFYYEEDYEGEPLESKYFTGENEEKEVTKEEYDEYVRGLVGNLEYNVFNTYNNDGGYEYLTREALDNRFNR